MEIRGLSLFANVGIAEAMFHTLGVKILVANELIERRAKFYQEVYPESRMICGDITDASIRDQIISESKKRKVNFVIATPPCQGMSVAGNRDDADPRNQLIYYAIEIIKQLKPEFVLLENVPRQLRTQIRIDGELIKIPDYIHRELDSDYVFNSDTLAKAKEFGIPQMRERNIFLLVKRSYGFVWEFPQKKRIVTLEDAIGDLPSLDPRLKEGESLTLQHFPLFKEKEREGLQVSKWHHPPAHPWRQVEWMMHTPSGTSAIYNDIYFPQKEDGSPIRAHHNHYRRMAWDKPARTIMMFNNFISTLATVHPGRPYEVNGEILYSDPRVLSVYELMLVMSIPKRWPVPNWVDDSFLRSVVGEGIPSKMACDIMKQLLLQIADLSPARRTHA